MKDLLDKVKNFFKKVWEKLKKVSKKVYIIAAVILVVLAALIVFLLNNRPYEILVTGVSPSETSSVINFLNSEGVTDYKVENDDTILVPESRADALKAHLLMQNFSQTGYYYSTYFDNVSSLSTESERTTVFLMDLQERMATTIRNFDNVKDAVVYITPGEDRGYILDSGNVVEASASVQVTMQDGARLSTQQASAIRELVTNAVQGLQIDNVSITDTLGNRYSTAADFADGDASALKLQLEQEQENKIRTNVMEVLKPFFGEDNVRVSVNCVVELASTTEDRTEVYLPEWAQDGSTGGRGIIGKKIWDWGYTRDGDDTPGGVVGTESNSNPTNPDISEYVENIPDLDGTERDANASGQTDYDNSRSQKHIITTAGYLTDCSVGVSVNSAVAGTQNLEELRPLIARAAGITGDINEETGEENLNARIWLVSRAFYNEPEDNPTPVDQQNTFLGLPMWVWIAAGIGLLLFVILMIVIILLVRRRKRRQEQAALELENREADSVDELLAAAGLLEGEEPTGADVMELQTERSMELRKNIRDFASDNPEIAAQMIKVWLKGGDSDD